MLEVTKPANTAGLILAAGDGPVPVCNQYITSIRFELDADQWLPGDSLAPTLLGELEEPAAEHAHLLGEATAPEAVFRKTGGNLAVPGGLWVEVPKEAVEHAIVMRVREMDWGEKPQKEQFMYEGVEPDAKLPDAYQSADFVFRKLMRRVGTAYDLKPNGFAFQRPISIALPLPMKPGIPEHCGSAVSQQRPLLFQ